MSVILPILQGVNGTVSDASSERSGNSFGGGQSSQSGDISVGIQADNSGQTIAPTRSNVDSTDISSGASTTKSTVSSGITTAKTAKTNKVGVPWPSPLMRVPFWMLVSNGHGWGWAFTVNNVVGGTVGSNISGRSASPLSTYL